MGPVAEVVKRKPTARKIYQVRARESLWLWAAGIVFQA